MTTDITAWVDEHRATHTATTQYPNVVPQSPTWIEAMKARGEYERDAKAHFPTALSMIEAVLELHRPIPIYEMEAYCPDESDEHVESRHVECAEMGGEYYCADRLLAHECGNCRDEDGSGIEYPCPTVRALEGVIDGE